MLGKQKCYPLCVLSLHLSQEVSDCVMKARLTGVQFKDAQYSQYTLQSSFTLDVHFPPDVGNIDGPIDLKVVEIAPAFQLDPHLRDRLHADAVNLARQVRMLYPYSPPPPPPPRCSCVLMWRRLLHLDALFAPQTVKAGFSVSNVQR